MEPTGYEKVRPDRLDATFAALADATRRSILVRLLLGDASVSELTVPFGMSQPAISKHLKVLERAGLVSRSRNAQRRLSRIEAQPLAEAVRWLECYRKLWADDFHPRDVSIDELKPQLKARNRVQRRRK